jgi:hypothetical protein
MNERTMSRETAYEPFDPAYRDDPSAFRRECDATVQAAGEQAAELLDGARQAFCRFAREQPEVTALCCLGIGFVLGWKLKPW